MDPFSILASVIGIGIPAIDACLVLMDLIATVDNASKEVEYLQRIVKNVYEDLETLRYELQQRNVQNAVGKNPNLLSAVKSLEEPIKTCTQNLEDIRSKLNEHLPTQSKFRSGLKWWWAKKDFQPLTTRLEGNKDVIKNKIQIMTWYVCSFNTCFGVEMPQTKSIRQDLCTPHHEPQSREQTCSASCC